MVSRISFIRFLIFSIRFKKSNSYGQHLIHLPATGALRGALIFTLFWGFRKFRGALIFFKKFAEILGCVYLHGFWWGALIFTFFLVDFSKDLHCKTPVLQKFSRCAGQISGERLFSHFFEERLLFSLFSFQKILKSAYYFEKILWNDPGAVIEGGIISNTLVFTICFAEWLSISEGVDNRISISEQIPTIMLFA